MNETGWYPTPEQAYDMLYRAMKQQGDLIEQSIATLQRLDDQETDETIGADLSRAIVYLQECRARVGEEIISAYDRLLR